MNQSFHNASDFDLKFLQRVRFWVKKIQGVRFWIKHFSTCQILKSVCIQKKSRFGFLLRENDIFCIFRAFLKSMILNWTFLYVTVFEFKKKQRVTLWVKNISTCQILCVLLLQFTKFSFIHQNRACFGNVLVYSLGSISQVILLGQALCTPTVVNVTRRIKTANPIQIGSSIYVDKECYSTMIY